MASGFTIRKNQYFDSVFLMGVNKKLGDIEGVQQTAVLMGTEKNKQLLADIKIRDAQIEGAKSNDLIVAVIADTSKIVEEVLENLDKWFQVDEESSSEQKIRTLPDALLKKPGANLAVISVPGEFAARESHKALDNGLNVFLFSSNVSIEEEVSLKKKASANGLLMMGPDCGTSLIGGVGIGFANNVRVGDIGVIGASGTGLQEFTSQVHNAGFGISHAIGTGGNDLSDEIGGLTTITALNALESDPNTRVIAIVSKPPGKKTLEKIEILTRKITKPVIGCFLGVKTDSPDEYDNLIITHTLDEAVKNSLSKSGQPIKSLGIELTDEEQRMALREREKLTADQKYSRGIFAGGTFCYQSQQIFQDAGIKVFSNGPIDKKMLLPDPDKSKEHTFVDMGDEHYTDGYPHPMIDSTFRNRRILVESRSPNVAVLFLDFILGHNASMDPVGDLLEAIIEAKRVAVQRGDYLCVVASLCGTEDDPQDLKLQEKLLMDAGVIAFTSNAKATMFCLELLK